MPNGSAAAAISGKAPGISERTSSQGRFLALTYTIQAESRAQLDRIYQDLTDSGVVLVAL